MKQYPTVYHLTSLMKMLSDSPVHREITKGDRTTWEPARPLGYPSLGSRFKAAWLVFRGRGDAVIWPEDS